MSITCNKCGQVLGSPVFFCPRCGTSLASFAINGDFLEVQFPGAQALVLIRRSDGTPLALQPPLEVDFKANRLSVSSQAGREQINLHNLMKAIPEQELCV